MNYFRKLNDKLNSIQKYQIFFFLTAILPIFAFTMLFLRNTQIKLTRAIENQVRPGIILVKEAIQENYNELRISSRQEIRHLIKNENSFKNKKLLNKNLIQYQSEEKLDIVMMLTPDGKIITSKTKINPNDLTNLKKFLMQARNGRSLFGIKLFNIQGNSHLSTYYLLPIHFQKTNSKGVLLVGDFLKNNNHFDSLSMLSPNYLIRIEEQNNKKVSKTFTKNIINSLDVKEPNQVKPKIIFERIDNTSYVSAILALQNNHSEIIGKIIFSLPYEQNFAKNNIIFIICISIFALIFVMLIGRWFEDDFIIPMNKLTSAFNDVSKGNLKTRLAIPVKQMGKEAANSFSSFNTMLDNLEENKNLKNSLIATLTHDLRTPLLAQERVIEILKDEEDSLYQKEKIQLLNGLIKSNCDLLEMVNSMLEVYEYEDGAIVLNKKEFLLEDLVNECFTDLQPLIQQKRINIETSCIPRSIKIYADRKSLKRVFINLMANAIQNIPKDSQIKYFAKKINSDIEIKIMDNGSGMTKEAIKHLFERYFSSSTLKKKIGSGLGLYICKTIVELHNGTIQAESSLGEGTTFTIRLPQENVE